MMTVDVERRQSRSLVPGWPWREVSVASRYGIVLLLLFWTFLFLIWGITADWARILVVALLGFTLIAALAAAQVSRRLRHLARFAALLSIAVATLTVLLGGRSGTLAASIPAFFLVVIAPFAIARSIVRHRIVDVQTVLGALCIYVLIGLAFAFLDTTIGAIQSGPFFVQQAHATSSEYVYFSFVTLTTTGYGDLTAANNLGRGFAVCEALFGQIYLVTIVALLVSNLGQRRRSGSELAGEFKQHPRDDRD